MTSKFDNNNYTIKKIITSITIITLDYLSYQFTNNYHSTKSNNQSTLNLNIYLNLNIVLFTLFFVDKSLNTLDTLIDNNFNTFNATTYVTFITLIITWTLTNPNQLNIKINTNIGTTNNILSLYTIFLQTLLHITLPLSSFIIIINTTITLLSIILALNTKKFETIKYTTNLNINIMMILNNITTPIIIYLIYMFLTFTIKFTKNFLSIKKIAHNTHSNNTTTPHRTATPTTNPTTNPNT